MADIFISHSVKNKKLAEAFREHILILGIGVSPGNVYCTSTPGQIPNGQRFVQHILANLSRAKLVIVLVSDDYNDSEFCLEEAGAAQLLKMQGTGECLVFLVPPASFSQHLAGMLFGIQAEMLNDSGALHNLKPTIETHLKMTPCVKPAVYSGEITEFLKYVKEAEELAFIKKLRVMKVDYDDNRNKPPPPPPKPAINYKLKLRVHFRNETTRDLTINQIVWNANKAYVKPVTSPAGYATGINVNGNENIPAVVRQGAEFNVWVGLRESLDPKDLAEFHENDELGKLHLPLRISGYNGEWSQQL